jgi:hypothetical protein
MLKVESINQTLRHPSGLDLDSVRVEGTYIVLTYGFGSVSVYYNDQGREVLRVRNPLSTSYPAQVTNAIPPTFWRKVVMAWRLIRS